MENDMGKYNLINLSELYDGSGNLYMHLHGIKLMPYSSVNRDDVGQQKTGYYGDSNRSRISSQCLNFHRRHFLEEMSLKLDGKKNISYRTTKYYNLIVEKVAQELGVKIEDIPTEYVELINELCKTPAFTAGKKETSKETLIYISEHEIETCARYICEKHDGLLANLKKCKEKKKAAPENVENNDEDSSESRSSKKKGKKAKKAEENIFDEFIKNELPQCHISTSIALFGRMFASCPDRNVIKSLCTSHSMGTNEVHKEYDYMSAIDDVKARDGEQGAGHLLDSSFNSSCYYDYANLSIRSFIDNLKYAQLDKEALKKEALTGIAKVIVSNYSTQLSGKNGIMCSCSKYDYFQIDIAGGGVYAMHTAFDEAVNSDDGRGILKKSIDRVIKWQKNNAKESYKKLSIILILDPDRRDEILEIVSQGKAKENFGSDKVIVADCIDDVHIGIVKYLVEESNISDWCE